MEPRKQAIVTALHTWINQRPGMDPRNYDRAGYLADLRKVQRQRRDAQTLLAAVELANINADALIAAFPRAFSGRLTLITSSRDGKRLRREDWFLDYTTGQYWCTEYRAAACAVLASALWEYAREHVMPENWGLRDGDRVYPPNADKPWPLSAHVSAGDWLRAHFRSQFGRGIASRWFA